MRDEIEFSGVEAFVCRYEGVECVGAKMINREFGLGDQLAPEEHLAFWVHRSKASNEMVFPVTYGALGPVAAMGIRGNILDSDLGFIFEES